MAPFVPEVDREMIARLSPREYEVLLLIAEGRTNREIAQALVLSERTVGNHITRLLAKLGATSRGQAAAIAYRAGALEH